MAEAKGRRVESEHSMETDEGEGASSTQAVWIFVAMDVKSRCLKYFGAAQLNYLVGSTFSSAPYFFNLPNIMLTNT